MQVAHLFRPLQLKASGSLRVWWRVGSRISLQCSTAKRTEEYILPPCPLQLLHSEQRKGNHPTCQGAPSSFTVLLLSSKVHSHRSPMTAPGSWQHLQLFLFAQHQMPRRVPWDWRHCCGRAPPPQAKHWINTHSSARVYFMVVRSLL